MVKLDLKDRKILYELDTNSRQSFHEIAKKVGLSKDSVIYRINKLQEEGIIKQFHAVIDVGKLGYISFRLYLKLQNTSPEQENELIEFLKKQKSVVWIASADGQYDLTVAILTKSIKEMNRLWKEIIKNYQDCINKKWLTIFTKVSYFPRAFILNKKQNFDEYTFISEPNEANLDKSEIEILKLLAADARTPILQIAKKLKLTPKTISNKIKRLEKEKIIVGYRTFMYLNKMDYGYYFKVFFQLHNLKEQKEKQFRTFIKQHPNVIYDNEVLGGGDLEIDIQVSSLQELRNIINEIKKQFSDIIKEHSYMLFYKEHKYVFLPI